MKSLFAVGSALAMSWPFLAAAAPIAGNVIESPPPFGSAGFAYVRDCSATPEGEFCAGGPENPTLVTVAEGSSNSRGPIALSVVEPGFGAVQLSADFSGEVGLPVLRGEAVSDGEGGVLGAVSAQQSYVYNGEEATPFALSVTVDFTGSSIGPVEGQTTSVAYDGQSLIQAILSISTVPSQPAGPTVVATPCGLPGALGFASAESRQGSGELSFDLSTGCDGNAIQLLPDQEYFIVAALSLGARGGGTVNSLSTFIVTLSEGLGVDVLTNLRTNLVPASTEAVPLPGALPLMMAGLMGGVAFTRRRTG